MTVRFPMVLCSSKKVNILICAVRLQSSDTCTCGSRPQSEVSNPLELGAEQHVGVLLKTVNLDE
jgi:hypothetical protein